MKQYLLIVILFLCSCHKDYSLEYFTTYEPDTANVVMKQSDNFKQLIHADYEKIGRDEFKVSIKYYDYGRNTRLSYGIFNHNGKQIEFKQEK